MAEKPDGSGDPRPRSKKYNVGRAVRHGVLTGLVLGGAATSSSDAIRSHIEDQLGRDIQGHTQELGADFFGKPDRSVNHHSRQVLVGSSLGRARAESRVQAAVAPFTHPEQVPQQIPLNGVTESLGLAGLGVLNPDKKRRFGSRQAILLSTLMALLASCGGQAVETAVITEAAPKTPIVHVTETAVPYIPPTVGAETVTPPPDVGKITLPDYTNFSRVGFTKPVTLEALKNGPVSGLTKAAQDVFRSNAQDLLNRLPDADQTIATAAVCYRPDLERNAVIITRPGANGMKEVFWLFRGTTPSFHPNFPSFQTTGDGSLTYKWVEVGTGDVVCKFDGEFPVVGTDVNAKDTVLSTIYAPASAKLVEAPVTPEAPKFAIDTLNLDPALTAALKKHAGLEASITVEADGRYTAAVTMLSEGQPVAKTVDLDPKTITQDLTTKNKYGDTPVMTTVDGQKLYWVQEEKAWFALEISPDIHKPVFVPFNQREVALRAVIAEFSQPFSQEAIDRWNAKSAQHAIGVETHQINAVTHEWTKWAYLINQSISDRDLTTTNSPIQPINAWFSSTIPDGTTFEYYFTKCLDPVDPRNPKSDEWKVMQNAVGTEISSNKNNRDQFVKDLFKVKNNAPVWFTLPIVKVDPNFFSNPNLPTILPIQQLSLNKLLNVSGNDFGQLDDPTMSEYSYKFDWKINSAWNLVTKTAPGYAAFLDTSNVGAYHTNWYPPEVQMILFPVFLMQR